MAWNFLLSSTYACFLPFEQFIEQQMFQLWNSNLECLHHHTFLNMFSDGISKAHYARILSCFRLKVGVWFIIWLIFLAFWLSSPTFFTTFHMWLRLPHLLIIGILRCMCTHPIDFMDIHLLCCVHGNEHIGTHNVVRNIFVAIAQNVNFHVGQE